MSRNSAQPVRKAWLPLGLAAAASLAVFLPGCAEGIFWRLGRFSPRVVEQWEQEEQIANSVFERKRQMQEAASRALAEGGDSLNRAARELGQTAISEPILINRVEAVRQLSRLNCPVTWEALQRASLDPEPEVRLAVVQAWQGMSMEQAVPALAAVFESDASVDVRLAAVRSLGNFQGQSSRAALQKALNDADPAIQLRATESLARVTGQSLGPDVRAWAQYLKGDAGNDAPVRQASQPAAANESKR